jgi:alpha-glucan,water dikinase
MFFFLYIYINYFFFQALIVCIKSDFDISVYWKTLNDNGITKERLLSYDRAIHSEPNFRRDQRDGLLRDLGNYMRTLKVSCPSH